MPSRSTAQRKIFAIAEHHPEKLFPRNRGLANLSQRVLREFAATKEKNLPKRIRPKVKYPSPKGD